jgi:cytochrome P450
MLYDIFISPLRSVPGPLLAKLSPIWIVLIDAAGDRTQTIHKLHQKYGPVVRIGPREVSFSDRNVIKDIYGQTSVYLKAPIYDSFSLKPPGIFSMRDKAQHRERRRQLSHTFSQSNLYDTEPIIADTLRKFLHRLDGNLGKPRDVLVPLRMLALDILGMHFRMTPSLGLPLTDIIRRIVPRQVIRSARKK